MLLNGSVLRPGSVPLAFGLPQPYSGDNSSFPAGSRWASSSQDDQILEGLRAMPPRTPTRIAEFEDDGLGS